MSASIRYADLFHQKLLQYYFHVLPNLFLFPSWIGLRVGMKCEKQKNVKTPNVRCSDFGSRFHGTRENTEKYRGKRWILFQFLWTESNWFHYNAWTIEFFSFNHGSGLIPIVYRYVWCNNSIDRSMRIFCKILHCDFIWKHLHCFNREKS